VTEIRSFRRVFDLERRIYTIDRLRLNPAGVPVRGVVYLLAALAASIFLSNLPVLSSPVRTLPWYLRELAFPAAVATVLAVVRVDGRTFHLAARAQLRLLATPRCVSNLQGASTVGSRWRPPEVVFLPDGSDHRLRALRYTGPGAVLVLAPHRRTGALERHGIGMSTKSVLRLAPARVTQPPRAGRVISLEPGASLLVAGGGADEHR
jgi:hypothetical protein